MSTAVAPSQPPAHFTGVTWVFMLVVLLGGFAPRQIANIIAEMS